MKKFLATIAEIRQQISTELNKIPLWHEVVRFAAVAALPATATARWALRTLPVLRRAEWFLETELLTRRHPVPLAFALWYMVWRGLQTTRYGHIGTDHMVYPLLAAISGFNPFLGLVCGGMFGIADLAQKLVYNDIYGAQSRFSLNYWGAMFGYVLAYSSTMLMGTLPGFASRVCRLIARKTVRAFMFQRAAAHADGARGFQSMAAGAAPDTGVVELFAGMAGAGIASGLVIHQLAPKLESPAFYMRPNPDRSCHDLEVRTHLIGQTPAAAQGGAVGGAINGLTPGAGGNPPPPGPPPVPSGPAPVINPFTGKALPTWDPKFGPGENGNPGEPGMVWFNGNWIPAQDARDFFSDSQKTDERRAKEQDQLAADNAKRGEDYAAQREKQLQSERQDEIDKRNAERELQNIKDIANKHGWDDVWDRATSSDPTDPNYVDRLRNIVKGRLGNSATWDQPTDYVSPFDDFATHTIDDVRNSKLIRIGTGILTGGSSEVVYVAQSAWNAMEQSANDAAAKGKPWDLTDALRSGYGQLIKDELPVNTLLTLTDPNKRTFGNIASSIFTDAMNTLKTRDTINNIGQSINAYQNGANWNQILTAKPTPPIADDPAKWPSEQPDIWRKGRNVNDLPEGSAVRPNDFGMRDVSGRQANVIADKYGVDINVRPTNPGSLPRLAAGDIPKPMPLKTNTINDLDVQLGADAVNKGRVGYFKPEMPDTTGMSADQVAAITKRFNSRMQGFSDNAQDMANLVAKGEVEVINGVVINRATGRAYTGDHDLFSITRPKYDPATGTFTNEEIPHDSPLYKQVVDDLKQPPFNAQHGAHMQWQYGPDDPHFNQYRGTDARIRAEHSPTDAGGDGSALVSFGPGRAPQTSYYHGPKDRFAQ